MLVDQDSDTLKMDNRARKSSVVCVHHTYCTAVMVHWARSDRSELSQNKNKTDGTHFRTAPKNYLAKFMQEALVCRGFTKLCYYVRSLIAFTEGTKDLVPNTRDPQGGNKKQQTYVLVAIHTALHLSPKSPRFLVWTLLFRRISPRSEAPKIFFVS